MNLFKLFLFQKKWLEFINMYSTLKYFVYGFKCPFNQMFIKF